MELTMRTYIKSETIIEVAGNIRYKIIGAPIGEGGCSIVYAAKKYIPAANGEYTESPLDYAIKECFPIGEGLNIYRDENGNIVAGDDASENQLALIKAMQKNEADVSGRVFNVGFRTTPVLETYDNVSIISENGEIKATSNLISILGSLSEKGQSLKSLLASTETKKLTAEQAFRIGEQLLYAVDEVHKAGYLHLDIQDGNVFLHGSLEDRNNMISLLDFGTAKELFKDNTCEVNPKDLYSTQGFTAPEILLCEEEMLRLGCQADIYSVGALMLYLLTGHKTPSRALIDNKSETFIHKFAIQSTKCPKHLVDRMQGIIAKALNVDAAKRYSSASEMLVDVADFLEAIAPYRNPLKSSKYDAFICYKHNKLDNMAAKTLRDSLERFKAKSLDKNDKQKIESVFMDEGELSSCADFGERINDALKNSEWLIVICSSETKESRWVNEEIRTFLKYHDKSHILAVITEGEPEDVYPLELKKNGLDASTLFAADARAEGDFNKTRKLAKSDVKLRICAAILGTTYDDLKQRNRKYVLKVRNTIIAGVLLLTMIFCSVFLFYSHKKKNELQRKNEVILSEQIESSQKIATYAFNNNDYELAVREAKKACQAAYENSSLSTISLFILSRIMQLYNVDGEYVLPIIVNRKDLPNDLAGYDDSINNIDTKLNKKIKDKNLEDVNIVASQWLNDGKTAILLTPNGIITYNKSNDMLFSASNNIISDNADSTMTFTSNSHIVEIDDRVIAIMQKDKIAILYGIGKTDYKNYNLIDVFSGDSYKYSKSEDAFYKIERDKIYKFGRCSPSDIMELSNFYKKLTVKADPKEENGLFEQCMTFETSDYVYMSATFDDASIPLIRYDKAKKTIDKLSARSFMSIVANDQFLCGVDASRKEIYRFDVKSGKVQKIETSGGVIGGLLIKGNELYFEELKANSLSAKGYERKIYCINLVNSDKKKANINIDTNYIPSFGEYELWCVVNSDSIELEKNISCFMRFPSEELKCINIKNYLIIK